MMHKLQKRDLVILKVIQLYNITETSRLAQFHESERATMAKPLTTKLLSDGLVTDYIQRHHLNMNHTDVPEQIYRATERLAAAHLITMATQPKRYVVSYLGTKILSQLQLTDIPSKITVGEEIFSIA
jgi:hypothetical protein